MHETRDQLHREPAVIRLSLLVDPGERSQVYREARGGRLRRLAPGVLVDPRALEQRTPEARHLLHVDAVWHRAHRDEVLSHRSAAVVWGLPVYGGFPDRPEVTLLPGVRRGSSRTFIRHRSERPLEPLLIDSRPVTSLARTVVDIATTRPFEAGVVVADAALRLVAGTRRGTPDLAAVAALRGEMREELHRLRSTRGGNRARRVIEFADPGAQLPGESVSRCTMLRIGCPLPQLQHRIESFTGQSYYLDFFWPEQQIGAEFDGISKYVDDRFTNGRSAREVLRAEKSREDEIRLDLAGFGRWGFEVAPRAELLGPLLRRIGLRW